MTVGVVALKTWLGTSVAMPVDDDELTVTDWPAVKLPPSATRVIVPALSTALTGPETGQTGTVFDMHVPVPEDAMLISTRDVPAAVIGVASGTKN